MRCSSSRFAVLFAVALALPLATTGPVRAESSQAPAKAQGRITVTGRGHVAAAPDMATVTLGVTTEAKTAKAAMTSNSSQLERVMAGLEGAGIAARDIQTSGLALNPRWETVKPSGERKITGFVASNRVTVRVRQLDELGSVLDSLVQAGANTVDGLDFGIAKPGPLQDEAQQKAVKEARRKAQLMAEAAGVTLGRVISITDGYVSQPQPMMRSAGMAESMSAPVPVAQGEVNLSATVTMVFAIKP